MNWLIIASPFLLAALVLAAIYGFEAYTKWSYRRTRRIRDARLQRYNVAAFRGAKDRFLS